MIKHLSVVLFALAFLASGCQEKPVPASLVSGSQGIEVLDTRFVSTGDSAVGTVGGANFSYLIVKVHFTNVLSEQLYPIVTHFVFSSQDGYRYFATDSGSTALIGISNNYAPLLRDQARDFVVGFRVPNQAVGQVTYEY